MSNTMKRRHFLKLAGGAIAALPLARSATAEEQQPIMKPSQDLVMRGNAVPYSKGYKVSKELLADDRFDALKYIVDPKSYL